LSWISETTERSERQFFFTRGYVATWNISILSSQRLANRRNWNLVCGKSISIDPNIDRTIKTPDHTNLTDSTNAFKLNANSLVCQLC
jgi:hypothetical protein